MASQNKIRHPKQYKLFVVFFFFIPLFFIKIYMSFYELLLIHFPTLIKSYLIMSEDKQSIKITINIIFNSKRQKQNVKNKFKDTFMIKTTNKVWQNLK